MGWKGTVRSIGAAARKAERNAKRRQRELEKKSKQIEKMEELEQAAYEVDVFENYLDVLQSVHKDCSFKIDWKKILSTPIPSKPVLEKKNEEKALKEYVDFTPNFFDKILGKAEKKENFLKKAVYDAKKVDKEKYEKLIGESKELNQSKQVAQGVLNGDPESKIKAIKEFDPFSELDTIGSNINITIDESGLIEASIRIHSSDIVPSEQKTLLKSGKLSVKKMPVGRFNEVYQDYVCSVVLRVANEIFAIVPDQFVLINAKDKLLNTSTGHLEEQVILSVYVSKETLDSLSLDTIDPSDSMSNFLNKMNFKKTKGFEPVSQLELKEINR